MAQDQGGYFTAKQARSAGYGYPHLDYHISTGAFERIDHGLYRLTDVPIADDDDLIRLSLWSRNRDDQPQAVISHESALIVHELTELLPDQIHLTVPPDFRKVQPPGCVLHKAIPTHADSEERIGYRVTTPLRTILDVAVGSTSGGSYYGPSWMLRFSICILGLRKRGTASLIR
jgi:predicted transcriptional regulator of viral defense system